MHAPSYCIALKRVFQEGFSAMACLTGLLHRDSIKACGSTDADANPITPGSDRKLTDILSLNGIRFGS